MEFYITFGIVVSLFGAWYYYYMKSRNQWKERDDNGPDDGSIFVQGRGYVRFKELDDMVNGDPDEGVKHVKDTMFREDLMKFEGEFLIPGLPLNEERRLSIDDAFLYLQELFGKEIMREKKVITPDDMMVPLSITTFHEIIPVVKNVAQRMDIDPESLAIRFHEGQGPVDPNSMDGRNGGKSAAGLYHGKNEQGKYEVSLADNIHQQPERLIAVIAHELAHIKLLGEGRMAENSEELTDMVPLVYGFGLFNSNAVFKFSRDNESWSTYQLGYLTQVDWAYLFALYLHVREESEPDWMKHLNKTIAKDCRLALAFIITNPDKVLQPQS